MVLLVADAPGEAAGVMGAVTARQGFVARRRGARYVGVFSGKDVEDPARAALAAAREIVERSGARAALHLAPAVLRPRAGAPAAYGAAIERPEAWLPAEPWSGLSLTPELSRLLEPAAGATAAFEESARRVEEARPLVEALGDPGLGLRLRVAEARTSWRRDRVGESIAMLERELDGPRLPGDDEPRRIARVMLAFELVSVSRLEDAEARFTEAFQEATAAGDLLHLCVAHANRVALWTARRTLERAIEDLQRAIELAREIGNPYVERTAANNVAVLLHWSDRQDEALPIARRSRLLEQRFIERPRSGSSLLLAEILVAMEEHAEPARLLQWIDERCSPAPSELPRLWTLRRVLAELGVAGVTPPAQDWDAIVQEALRIYPVEGVLLRLYWRARMASMAGPEGLNGLDPVDFWTPANQQALRGLAAGALLDGSGALVSTALLDTAGGRSVLGYTIRCALAGGDSVARDGAAFDGQLGLAPAWASRGLTTSEQRWMTACLLQHLNGLAASPPPAG